MDRLYNKKQELENELANQVMKQEDYNEIAEKVSKYEESLLNEKQVQYAKQSEKLKAQIEIVDELINTFSNNL